MRHGSALFALYRKKKKRGVLVENREKVAIHLMPVLSTVGTAMSTGGDSNVKRHRHTYELQQGLLELNCKDFFFWRGNSHRIFLKFQKFWFSVCRGLFPGSRRAFRTNSHLKLDVGMSSKAKPTTTVNDYGLFGIKTAKSCGILQDNHTFRILAYQQFSHAGAFVSVRLILPE